MKAPEPRQEPEQVQSEDKIPDLREKLARRLHRERRLRLELQRIATELGKK